VILGLLYNLFVTELFLKQTTDLKTDKHFFKFNAALSDNNLTTVYSTSQFLDISLPVCVAKIANNSTCLVRYNIRQCQLYHRETIIKTSKYS